MASLGLESCDPAAPWPLDHRVQFYAQDEVLVEGVSQFLLSGLQAGENAIAVATPAHLAGIRQALGAAGVDLVRAQEAGALVLSNAEETLASLLVEGKIDLVRFEALADSFLEKAEGKPRRQVRFFGEMVDLLRGRGDAATSMLLEELWASKLAGGNFRLLCGYSMSRFPRENHTSDFDEVCSMHSRVFPPSVAATEDDHDPRLARMALLEQRALALESEIASRRDLERALRSALAERSRTEEELRASHDQLARALRFSETFVGVLGHDLRNPLSAVTIAASLLVRRADSDTMSRPAVRILASAGRMSRMIDQLLDFTHIRLGRGLPLSPTRTDLAAVCSAVIDELDADRDRVRFLSTGEPVGLWDRDRLAQLVSNLVSNALAHGAERGLVTVEVREKARGHVALSVHNHGQVLEHVLPRIFDPFESATDLKQVGASGLGLGLYISRQVVIAHGGTIEVLSSAEGGTTFSVDLPRSSWVPAQRESIELQDRPGGG